VASLLAIATPHALIPTLFAIPFAHRTLLTSSDKLSSSLLLLLLLPKPPFDENIDVEIILSIEYRRQATGDWWRRGEKATMCRRKRKEIITI